MNLRNLIDTYGLKINGIIQVGTSGDIEPQYKQIRIDSIVYIDPAQGTYELIERKVKGSAAKCYNVAVGNFNGEAFAYACAEREKKHIASMLKPKNSPLWGTVITVGVKVKKLDFVGFKKTAYNMLVLDCEGYEYEVLHGATDTLPFIDYIYVNFQKEGNYEDQSDKQEVADFLTNYKSIEISELEWLFVKKVDEDGKKIQVERKEVENYTEAPAQDEPKPEVKAEVPVSEIPVNDLIRQMQMEQAPEMVAEVITESENKADENATTFKAKAPKGEPTPEKIQQMIAEETKAEKELIKEENEKRITDNVAAVVKDVDEFVAAKPRRNRNKLQVKEVAAEPVPEKIVETIIKPSKKEKEKLGAAITEIDKAIEKDAAKQVKAKKENPAKVKKVKTGETPLT